MSNMETSSYKASIPLAQVCPSKENPRKDFGDIDALADRIRATGGQPVNPIVVVGDGGTYHIVDGERRYRAMLKVAGEDGSVDALVYADYGAAHAAVAMLATDDKQPLTATERARGFQTMINLDVPVDTLAMASGIDRHKAERARTTVLTSARVREGAQASLDALIIAGDDEFSPEERDKIATSSWPESVAKDIRSSHKRARKLERLKGALPEAVDFIGREYVLDYDRSGLVYVLTVRTLKDAQSFCQDTYDAGERYVAFAPVYERETPTWEVYRLPADGEAASEELAAEEVEESRRAAERARRKTLMMWLRTSMMSWLVRQVLGCGVLRATVDHVVSQRGVGYYDLDDDDAEALAQVVGPKTPPSAYELVKWLDGLVGDERVCPDAWNTYYYSHNDERILLACDLLRKDGWEPDEFCQKVIGACKRSEDAG